MDRASPAPAPPAPQQWPDLSLSVQSAEARRDRLVSLAVLIAVAAWTVVAWVILRPRDAAASWNGQRQADTLTIILNLMKPGESILYPRIAWGGEGPGFVETEFQIYAGLTAMLARVIGSVEMAGQAISLASIVGTAAILWFHLRRRYGVSAAAIGMVAFFGSRSVVCLSTAVQPDGLCLLVYTAAWVSFCLFVDERRSLHLILFAVLGAVAMLTKPPAATLGISSAILLLLEAPRLLRSWKPWVAWLLMLVPLVLFLRHAHSLYETYGNTFGVLSGNEGKLPKLRHLLMPKLYLSAAKNCVVWGTGVVGALAVIILAVRRRLSADLWALLIGNSILTLVAFRYTATTWGLYYFAFTSILGAGAVASLAKELLPLAKGRTLALAISGLALVANLFPSHRFKYEMSRYEWPGVAMVQAGRELAKVSQPGALVVVQGTDTSYDEFWGNARNFHEARVFYASNSRGWVFASNEADPKYLADTIRRGARYFVEPLREPTGLSGWLQAHATLLATTGYGGRIWKLPSAP